MTLGFARSGRTLTFPTLSQDGRPELLINLGKSGKQRSLWVTVDTRFEHTILPISVAEVLGIGIDREQPFAEKVTVSIWHPSRPFPILGPWCTFAQNVWFRETGQFVLGKDFFSSTGVNLRSGATRFELTLPCKFVIGQKIGICLGLIKGFLAKVFA